MISKKISTMLSQLPLASPVVPGERGRHLHRYRRQVAGMGGCVVVPTAGARLALCPYSLLTPSSGPNFWEWSHAGPPSSRTPWSTCLILKELGHTIMCRRAAKVAGLNIAIRFTTPASVRASWRARRLSGDFSPCPPAGLRVRHLGEEASRDDRRAGAPDPGGRHRHHHRTTGRGTASCIAGDVARQVSRALSLGLPCIRPDFV